MLHPLIPSPGSIAATADVLRGGGLAILPTDTVYGIVADIRQDSAVQRIYDAKGKGESAPLQLLLDADPALIARYATLTESATKLLDALGPGGWTLICPALPGWQSPALAGGATVGIRVPAAPVVHDVVRALGAPLAASSANRHGSASPVTCPAAIGEVWSSCVVALDGGATISGLDSTVIDCASDSPRILREGAIDRATIARILAIRDIPVLRSVRP